jgi:hypothetical protein
MALCFIPAVQNKEKTEEEKITQMYKENPLTATGTSTVLSAY